MSCTLVSMAFTLNATLVLMGTCGYFAMRRVARKLKANPEGKAALVEAVLAVFETQDDEGVEGEDSIPAEPPGGDVPPPIIGPVPQDGKAPKGKRG
jgi:hypothetical protein